MEACGNSDMVIRAVLAAALGVAVVVGGFVYGAINTLTDEDLPDYE